MDCRLGVFHVKADAQQAASTFTGDGDVWILQKVKATIKSLDHRV